MRFKQISFFAFIFALIACTSILAAPANDNFSNAAPLQLQGESVLVVSNNTGATKETGEPAHAENIGGKSVWFSYTAQTTTVLRIRTSEITFDTLLAVYTGSSVNNLTPIAYNDNCYAGCNGDSILDLMVTAGQTYYIAVDSLNDNGTVLEGSFKLVLFAFDAPLQDNFASPMDLGNAYKGSIGGTNYNATREANEPDHGFGTPGVKTVWYRWKSPASNGMTFELKNNFQSIMAIYSATTPSPSFAQLTLVNKNSNASGYTSALYRTKFFAEANKYYFIVVGGLSEQNNPSAGNFQLKFYPNYFRTSAAVSPTNDRSALAVFRPSEGIWYRLQDIELPYSFLLRWGKDGDTPIMADFNGDAAADYAVARNENGVKMWHISHIPGATTSIQWGLAADKVAVGDFDRDSRADLVAIRLTAQGFVWYVRQSSNGALRVFYFGTLGDAPVLGDFDGDGFTDVTVVRNTQQGFMWYTLKSGFDNGSPMYTQLSVTQFGQAPDKLVVEDFDGDGKTDITVWRPSNGFWYFLRSSDGLLDYKSFGQNGDVPQPADYDGDRKADMAVFRPSDGRWYIMKSGNNQLEVVNWGAATDIPATSLATLAQ